MQDWLIQGTRDRGGDHRVRDGDRQGRTFAPCTITTCRRVSRTIRRRSADPAATDNRRCAKCAGDDDVVTLENFTTATPRPPRQLPACSMRCSTSGDEIELYHHDLAWQHDIRPFDARNAARLSRTRGFHHAHGDAVRGSRVPAAQIEQGDLREPERRAPAGFSLRHSSHRLAKKKAK